MSASAGAEGGGVGEEAAAGPPWALESGAGAPDPMMSGFWESEDEDEGGGPGMGRAGRLRKVTRGTTGEESSRKEKEKENELRGKKVGKCLFF